MKAIYIGLVATAVLIGGCSRHPMDPDMDMKPPKYVEQMDAKEDQANIANAGSLFGQGENPLYSDRKAMKVNDIVRVVISETATSSSSSSKSLSKNQQDNLGGGVIASPGANLNPQMTSIAGRANGFLDIGLTSSSNYSFSGTGKGSRQESFTTTISARVIKVMANGTYFIDGTREIMIDGEKQIIRVSGVIRADDIAKDNSISSAYISDAKIVYETQGELKRTATQSWGSKFFESIWPF